jgi:hypothetical protein
MDKHFVSYPKSGRTWIRYMLVQLAPQQDIHFHHDHFEFNDGACPPHDFSIERRLEEYAHVERLVYLERDPRDVMVSLYHQITGRFRDFFHYKGSLSEFIRDPYFGAANLLEFRRMWEEVVRRRGFLKVTYEQCHQDARGTLRRIAEYYGLEAPAERLEAAVAEGAFDRMRSVEIEEAFPQPWLRPRNGMTKVRKGKVGSHAEELGPQDIAYLDAIFFPPAERP